MFAFQPTSPRELFEGTPLFRSPDTKVNLTVTNSDGTKQVHRNLTPPFTIRIKSGGPKTN